MKWLVKYVDPKNYFNIMQGERVSKYIKDKINPP